MNMGILDKVRKIEDNKKTNKSFICPDCGMEMNNYFQTDGRSSRMNGRSVCPNCNFTIRLN